MMTATLGEALPPPQPDPRRAMEPYGHVLANGRSVVVRLLAPGDDALMAEFFASLSTREIYYFFPLGDAAARRLATDAPTDRACRVVAVGEHQGRAAILGYMFLEWERDGPPTFGACLRGDAQSSGLGRVLIDHVLSAATACGMERVQLTAHADNWRALRLYQRAGFRLTGEFILQPQGAKQYRMEVDLRIPRPLVWADLTVVARGGLGVGLAAGRIQEAIEVVVGRRPLILDRPMSTDAYALIVSDLAAAMERPFEIPIPSGLVGGDGPAWLVTLDDHHLLIGGIGAAAVDRAARAYTDLLAAQHSDGAVTASGDPPSPPHVLPFGGLCRSC